MHIPARPETALRVVHGTAPLVAVLDTGLDPFAPLQPGTRVLAARSFVGGHALHDAVGSGTAAAAALAVAYAGRWSDDGRTELRLVVAQVADRAGVDPDAVAAALGWVRFLGVEAVAVTWAGTDLAALRGPARRLAHAGVTLLDVRAADALLARVQAA